MGAVVQTGVVLVPVRQNVIDKIEQMQLVLERLAGYGNGHDGSSDKVDLLRIVAILGDPALACLFMKNACMSSE